MLTSYQVLLTFSLFEEEAWRGQEFLSSAQYVHIDYENKKKSTVRNWSIIYMHYFI